MSRAIPAIVLFCSFCMFCSLFQRAKNGEQIKGHAPIRLLTAAAAVPAVVRRYHFGGDGTPLSPRLLLYRRSGFHTRFSVFQTWMMFSHCCANNDVFFLCPFFLFAIVFLLFFLWGGGGLRGGQKRGVPYAPRFPTSKTPSHGDRSKTPVYHDQVFFHLLIVLCFGVMSARFLSSLLFPFFFFLECVASCDLSEPVLFCRRVFLKVYLRWVGRIPPRTTYVPFLWGQVS